MHFPRLTSYLKCIGVISYLWASFPEGRVAKWETGQWKEKTEIEMGKAKNPTSVSHRAGLPFCNVELVKLE